jgi:transglutaminase-like putative cysteine protease
MGIVVAFILVGSVLAGREATINPGDPHSIAIAGVWLRRLVLGATLGSGVLHVFFFYSVVCGTAGWMAWSIVRLRNLLLGLLPLAAVFAVGLLNSTSNDSVLATVFLALLLALLLLTNVRRLRGLTLGTSQALSGPARRRYWALGSGMIAAAVIGSAVLPPLSTTDISDVLQGQLNAIRTWLGDPAMGAGHAGFSLDVPLNGPLLGNSQVVFTYTVPTGSAAIAPLYFRGADLTQTSAGQWRLAATTQRKTIPARTQIAYAESYEQTTAISVVVQPVNSPPTAPATLFYPGQLMTASAPLTISQSTPSRERPLTPGLRTLDLAEITGSSATLYVVESQVSAATADQLRAAGDAFPSWVIPYTRLSAGFRIASGSGAFSTIGAYRPAATLQRIHQLALSVTANAANPYDQAMAVETYLRANYRYSLSPAVTPAGKDAIDNFLFTSKAGYCQYFATAMGDMLRSLGIPTRLVNGFGPGSPTSIKGQYMVTESDAHTWVEAYFPAYGWIPFEPTPQSGYASIGRGLAPLPSSAAAPTPSIATPPSTNPTAAPASRAKIPTAVTTSGERPWLAIVAALLLMVGISIALFARRPRTIRSVWRRLRAASYLAGVPKRRWETPIEFGERLTRRFPELTQAIETLSGQYSHAAYANVSNESVRPSTVDALSRLERHLARVALHGIVPAKLRNSRNREE